MHYFFRFCACKRLFIRMRLLTLLFVSLVKKDELIDHFHYYKLTNKCKDDILFFIYVNLLEYECVHDIWISPVTHDDVKRCPWLRKLPNQDKYVCRIHDVKPEHCSAYPKSRQHAKETRCQGFD